MWIKQGHRTYQIFGHNIHLNDKNGKYELWVSVAGKQSVMVLSGNKEDVEMVYNAINFTIEDDRKLLEL